MPFWSKPSAAESDDARAAGARVEQMRILQGSSATAAFINFANACILTYVFWGALRPQVLVAWLVFNAFYTVLLFADGSPERAATSPWPQRIVVIRATLLGLVWGGFVWAMTEVADADSMLVAGIVMVGMMAGGAVRLAIIPAASYGFVGTMAATSMAASIVHLDPLHGTVAALLTFSYAAFLVRHASAYSAAQVQSWRDRIDLAARNETVSLLLNNFHDNASDWVWEVDAEGLIREPSDRFREAAGGVPLYAHSFTDLFDRGGLRDALARLMQRREHFREVPVTITVDGRRRHWSVAGKPSGDGGYQGVASDVTEKVEAQQRLAYLAHFDELTGLQSRVRFFEEVEHALSDPHPGEVVALYYLDLDRFKSINDTMGHPFGDGLLAAVGERLRQGLGRGHVIARLGGDEFAILRRMSEAEWKKSVIGDDILALFERPFTVDNSEIALNVSVGVRVLDSAVHGGADEVLRDADLALYKAKSVGRGCCRLFEPDMSARATRRLMLEQGLRTAIANRELMLFFQPYACMKTGDIVGLEALMRWHSPAFGAVSPDEFIPIAEESGLILSIGEWAIGEAIREATRWPAHLQVSVNLSPHQFRTPAMVVAVARALRESGLQPDRLELEITESTLLDGTENALAAISSLKMLGVRIALDDFGTGFSSLSYICQFPFDKIKIDKAFVRGVTKSASNASVVKAITELGVSLGITITAEGIEDAAQLETLRNLGCHQMQGFLLAPPLPPEQALALVEARVKPGTSAEASATAA